MTSVQSQSIRTPMKIELFCCRDFNQRNTSTMQRLALIGIVALFLISGCRNFPPKLPPKVEKVTARVVELRIAERSADGTRFEAVIELDNPNRFALPLREVTYSVSVGGQSQSLVDNAHRTVPGKGSQQVVLPASFPITGDLTGVNYNVSGRVEYEAPGELRDALTEAGIPLPTSGFAGKGSL